MKKILLLCALLALILCSCQLGDLPFPTPETTPEVTTPGVTTPAVTTPAVTTPEPSAHKHLYEAGDFVTEPTCTTAGERIFVCACGSTTKMAVPATGKHIYENAILTKAPTCVESGEQIATCACGATETTTVPATGKHTYGEAVVTKQPTCAEAGEKTATCAVCGATEVTAIPATGKHIYENAVLTKAPTCVENGEQIATCVCGATETTTVPATGEHIYGEAVVTKQPTCAEAGEKTATCAVCGATEVTAVPATGKHIYENAVLTKAPTCVESGEQIATCACGATETTIVPATGKHTYGEAVVTKQPTCVEAGEKTAACAVCGATEVTVIPATGEHIYKNGKCSLCDYSSIPLYAVPSIFDANGDGEKDTYNFSPQLLKEYENGIHVWAGQYHKTLSANPSSSSAGGVTHWYVTEFTTQTLVFKVTVDETGVYEMVINVRLKDAQVRGTKYTVNGGTDNEQVFETSYGYTGMNYTQIRNETHGAYMYGVTVNLLAGENTIKIEHAPDCPKSQHYRDFYFVKVGEYHAHSFQNETVTKPATCSESGESIATCSCGKTRTTIIPPTYEHTYENVVCTQCGREYVPAGIVSYDFLYNKPGFAGGTVTLLPETTDVYTFYWANEVGKLANYSMLYSGEFAADVEAELTIQSFTAIPTEATRLIAVSGDGDVSYSYTIPTERLLVSEELYVFGALSDTHQGERYGSTSVPYNHFVNAAKTLYDKGAITIGICGDFSYENEEFEYALHADALREIYAYAPTMPIFTTSGNHEAKYTGFSKDWYMEYTRGVVDYDSDLDFTFFDGNDLDYVIELPDGSVMIFFHQIYYDYGSSTSRLVTDEQLEWLEARLEEYKDRTVFFFFHTFMDEEVGDASISGNEYSLPMISSTVEYKKFTEYFTKYTNVVYFSGHSHWAFDSQFVTPKPGKTNYDKNIDNRDGSFATMVHIPACSTPRVLVGSGNGRSEGYVVYVYDDCVVLQGYEFAKGEAFAYATYIIPKETTHTHSYTKETIVQEPTCNVAGSKTLTCDTCGETKTVSIPATGEHNYVSGACTVCNRSDVDLIEVSSAYDADGDGKNDVYGFYPSLLPEYENGIYVWAGDYDKKLSSATVSTTTVANIRHWYVASNGSQYIVYRVTVPEDGVYEMVIHMRLKDGEERGTKYTVNGGTANEQVFQVSHAFSGEDYIDARNPLTLSSYMYGIRVKLVAGENTIRIDIATNSSKAQHYRDFYFLRVDGVHVHSYTEILLQEPTCTVSGIADAICSCGDSKTISIPATGEHTYAGGICIMCGSGQEIVMTDVSSIYDADGDGATDIYQFSPTLLNFCTADYTVHVWAGDYDKTLSSTVSTTTAGGLRHWYLADDGSQYIVYRVTVPEDGTYEMVLHFRMKDGRERGAKFIINEGTEQEQIFSTSHSFSGTDYEKVRDATTLSSYMYGIKVRLSAGENIIKIVNATTEKSQHFRDFYFVNLAKKHRHVYEYEISHKAPTCVEEGANEFACACGEHIVAVLPATGLHVYVDGFCTACGQKDPGYGIIAYEYLFDAAGFAGGTVTVRTEKTGVFNLYWGNDEGILPNYTMLCFGSFRAYVPSQITIHTQTAIPAGATRLLVVNSAGEVVYVYDIPAERQFNKTELYLFGALSDTHQGTRYGPESQSLDRLVNAGSILAEKGAILLGINGDIANANTEHEYILHGEALKGIFEVAPHMPVYSVSGNHEAKNIGFSRDWYIHYTREIVDYDTEYTPIFTEDNDLDFVVELPDGSVIIFLHQVYYDYGKTTSRLLDDYQLDWLGDRFEQYKDRTVFLFFHTEMEDKVGHFTAETNLVMKKYTEDYKRLDAYFQEYTNVIFFSGHSHNSFDTVFDAEHSSRVINTYGGEYATLVHIPSLADNIADGYIVHVYEDCIVFEGYEFENDEAFAYATFIIEK